MKIQNFEYVEQATASGMETMHNRIILRFALALTPSSSSSLLLLSLFLDLSFVVIKELLETERAFLLKKWLVLLNISVGFFFPVFNRRFENHDVIFKKSTNIFLLNQMDIEIYRYCSNREIYRYCSNRIHIFFIRQLTQFPSVRFIIM